MTRTVIVPDLQVPLHDKRLVHRFADFLAAYAPDEVAFVGDVSDSTETARWSKGYKAEHGNLQKALDDTHDVLALFREAVGPNVPMTIERSNHDDRTTTYVRTYAPALASMRGLDFAGLVGLEELDITFCQRPIEVAPGWIVLHGDEGRMSQVPGQTALKLAAQAGRSVVCGHTHRAGLMHATEAYGGRPRRTLWGMEVGHFMDLNKASYLKLGGANWQQAFGLLYIEGAKVTPALIPVLSDGSFLVEGKRHA